jgi:hypothetical protein
MKELGLALVVLAPAALALLCVPAPRDPHRRRAARAGALGAQAHPAPPRARRGALIREAACHMTALLHRRRRCANPAAGPAHELAHG